MLFLSCVIKKYVATDLFLKPFLFFIFITNISFFINQYEKCEGDEPRGYHYPFLTKPK